MNDVNYLSIKETMSSLEIAELTNRDHKNILRDIRNLLDQGVQTLNFEQSFITRQLPNGGHVKHPFFKLTKKGCLILASGYDALLREKIINRWEELELENQKATVALPQNYLEALEALVETEKQKQALQVENVKQKEVISHKSDVIEGLTEDIELAEKRQRITQIVRYNSTDFQKRYRLLYKEFELKYHMSLNRRINSEKVQAIKPEIKNKIDYIDRVLNMIPELYEIACKIFETDVKKLIKREWKIYNLQEC